MRTPLRCFATLFALLALSAAPALAGANRWTTSGPNAVVNHVAIDPLDSNILYAATEKGVFKSTDGGLSWSDPSGGELDGTNVHCLTVDPVTPSTLHAGVGRGILKSTDAGATWSDRRTASAIYNLVFGSQMSTIYAADLDDVGYYPGPSAVYRSTDDGETWSSAPSGFSIRPGTLVVDPTEPSTLYALPYYEHGALKSVDAGVHWRLIEVGTTFVHALAPDPVNPGTLYASSYVYGDREGRAEILKSTDRGSTWSLLSGQVRASSLVINPRDPTILYAGTDYGVFRSTDGGVLWDQFDEGLNNFVVLTLAIDSAGARLHAGTPWGVFDRQVSGAVDLSVGTDNRTRMAFSDAVGRLVLQSADRSGKVTSSGPFGPYRGWDPRAVADGSDGLTRVLWTTSNRTAALWLVGPAGVQASHRIPSQDGRWVAVDVAASISGATHILWTDVAGRIALGTVGNAGDASLGIEHGPYPGWTAVAIADGGDGWTRLLWRHADGSAALWILNSSGVLAAHRLGGAAGWAAADVAVGADGQSRILWTHRDGRMALWRVEDAGNPTAKGPVYSPPRGFAATRVSTGSDGLTRVLWSDRGGSILWLLSADNVFQESIRVE